MRIDAAIVPFSHRYCEARHLTTEFLDRRKPEACRLLPLTETNRVVNPRPLLNRESESFGPRF